MKTKLNSLVLLALAGAVPSTFAGGVVSSSGSALSGGIDYVNAKPIPLPKPNTPPPSLVDTLLGSASSSAFEGASGFSAGNRGNGQMSAPIKLPNPASVSSSNDEIAPQEYGSYNNYPYTTNRTDAYGDITTKYYPFRAAGKLYFKVGANSYVCSASLIKRGVLVTAAHCVADFGKNTWHTNFIFYPGLDNNHTAYYGYATGRTAYALSSYLNGTDSCAQAGVICKDDVAVILLNPQSSGSYIGASTGWLGYGYGGYGFTPNNLALITQLGYPVALDGGKWQERTDSQGYVNSTYSSNTIIGSLQAGGSSGGPWIVNLGWQPALSSSVTLGYEASRNVVVGTTSWGYVATNPGPKLMGASPFLSTNIVPLVNAACAAVPAACS